MRIQRNDTLLTIDAIKQRLLENLRHEQYAGYDPFDGLNSRLLKMSGLHRFPLVRLAWIQVFKRCPVNLRPLVGVPKCRNPKGIALVILGLLQDFEVTKDQALLEEAKLLGDWLLEHSCSRDDWKYFCWGYPFPWQTRAFFVPDGTPNIITTCYAARALWLLKRVTGLSHYMEAACDAAWFIARNLYVQHNGRRFLTYIPGETVFVHNANLWGSAVLALAYRKTGKDELADMACEVARQSVNEQHSDGSWPYGTRNNHRFIDSFHTGYNLEALYVVRQQLQTEEFDVSIDSGMQYYRTHFFFEDGTPKYYHDSVYPIDMHSVAQAVLTLSRVGGSAEDHAIVHRVMHWAVKHMYCPKTGYFYYQINRFYRNRISYLRWTQAWAYLALASYSNNYQSTRATEGNQ